MSTSTTTRFGIYRWSSDADAFTRTQADESHKNLEIYLAKMLSGTTVPSIGLSSYAKTLFLNRTNNRIYYYTTEDASGEWVYIETDVILSIIAEAKGDLIVASAPNTWTILPVGTVNQILTVLNDSADIGWSTILTAKGDLLTLEGTSATRIGVGSNNQILHSDSSSFGGLRWTLAQTQSIANSAVTSVKINDAAVTTQKIVDSSVVTSKIADAAISALKISNNAVDSIKISDLAVTTEKVAASSIVESKLAASSVITSKIQNDAVITEKILDSAVIESKLANLAVTEEKILDNSVTATKIAPAAVTQTVLADNAVTELKIAEQNVVTQKIASGAIITAKILNNAVTGVKIAANSVGTPQINDLAVTTGKIGEGQVVSSKFLANSITDIKIADSNVTTAKISDQSVSTGKFSPGSVTNIKLRPFPSTTVFGNHKNIEDNPSNVIAANDNTALLRSGNALTFSQVITPGFADSSVNSDAILNSTLINEDFNAAANINLTKLGSGPLPTGIKTDTINYIDRSITQPKLNATANPEGVGVWLDYTPSLFYTKYAPGGVSYNPTGPYGEQLVGWPGFQITADRYSVLFSKYCRINNLCLAIVTVRILGGIITELGNISITLPFSSLTPNYQVVGTSTVVNADAGYYGSGNTYNQQYTLPVIMNNRIGFVHKWKAVEFVAIGNWVVAGIFPGGNFSSTSNTNPPEARQAHAYIEGNDILSFNIAYETTA